MLAIIVSNVEFDNFYYIDLRDLAEVFPHIKEDKDVELHLVEIRNEQNKLVKRFKPFKKLQLKTKTYWYEPTQKRLPCLLVPEEVASQFNIGKYYKVASIITKYDAKSFLPLEIKIVGYDAQKVLESFAKNETSLLSLCLDQPILNKAINYLWDAYFGLEENDVEGTRTSIRNSLEVLENDFLPKIKVLAEFESSKFPNKLSKLINDIKGFLHYGGPHPGPAPRTTTEMTISLTVGLITYLGKALESKSYPF
ncbi:MAG: hypothetical protein QXX08_08495 [Candidatus Bathyarchaeia archaeon]